MNNKLKIIKNSNVEIITGINGAGKSIWLRDKLNASDNTCIAISTTYENKISKIRTGNKHILTPTHHLFNTKRLIIEFLIHETDNELEEKKNYIFETILKFINFENNIGISISNLNIINNKINSFFLESEINETEIEKIKEKTQIFQSIAYLMKYHTGNFLSIQSIELRNSKEWNYLFYLKILLKFQREYKINFLQYVKFFLYKENNAIPLESCSSGEMSLFRIFIFSIIHVKENFELYIDEPENSLHPHWQYTFIQNILAILYFFNPKVFIATHSPLIIAGLDINLSENSRSIEEVMLNDLMTLSPKNYFLADKLISIIESHSINRENKEDTMNLLQSLLEATLDEKQNTIINFYLDRIKNESNKA